MVLTVAGLALAAGTLALIVAVDAVDPQGKSGSRIPRDLDLALVGYPGGLAARIAERFAGRVEALSNGSMRSQNRVLAHTL